MWGWDRLEVLLAYDFTIESYSMKMEMVVQLMRNSL